VARPVGSVNKVAEEIKVESEHQFQDGYIGEAKVAHLAIGVDLLGSKTSLVAGRGNTLTAYSFGVVATSGKNGRKILVYAANIKAVELL